MVAKTLFILFLLHITDTTIFKISMVSPLDKPMMSAIISYQYCLWAAKCVGFHRDGFPQKKYVDIIIIIIIIISGLHHQHH